MREEGRTISFAPSFYVCGFLFLGILVGEHFSWVGILIVGLLFCLLMVRKKFKKYLLLVFVFAFLIGFFRSSLFFRDFSESLEIASQLVGQSIILQGRVVSSPERKIYYQKVILEDLKIKTPEGQFSLSGKALLETDLYPIYSSSSVLEVRGQTSLPEERGDFSYFEYLNNQEIFYYLKNPKVEVLASGREDLLRSLFSDFRNKLESKIKKIYSEPEASLLIGMILGKKSEFNQNFDEALRKTGLTHIVVVSGTNISILAFLIIELAPVLGRRKTVLLSLFTIFFYVILIGLNPPAIRAFLMALLGLSACLLGRKSSVLNALILSGTLMVFINPLSLKDLSFQLSFLSTLGIILLGTIFIRLLSFLPTMIKEAIGINLAAQILILPIIIFNFGELSAISPLTNFLVSPLVVPLTILGFLSSIISFIWVPLGVIASLFILILLKYFIWVVEFFGQFSWSVFSFPNLGLSIAILFYFCILLVTVRYYKIIF